MTMTRPERMPRVITQVITEKVCACVMVCVTDAPIAPAAMVAAGSS